MPQITLKKKLDRMIGRIYLHNTRHHRIINYDLRDGCVKILTDKKVIDMGENDVEINNRINKEFLETRD